MCKKRHKFLLIEELLVDRQLTELQDEHDALSEKRDNAQKNFHEFTEKNQEQVRIMLTDAVFGRLVGNVSLSVSEAKIYRSDLNFLFS